MDMMKISGRVHSRESLALCICWFHLYFNILIGYFSVLLSKVQLLKDKLYTLSSSVYLHALSNSDANYAFPGFCSVIIRGWIIVFYTMSCTECQMQGKPVNNLISREIPALVEKGRCLGSRTVVNHMVIIKLHNYKEYFLSFL